MTASKKILASIVATLLVAVTVVSVLLFRQQSLASCLIGSWRSRSAVATTTIDGHATTNTIAGLRLQYLANGTTEQFYTDAIARLDGDMSPLSGAVTYEYRLRLDRVTYTKGRGPDQSPERDYAETAQCRGDELTLVGTIDYDHDSHTTWTTRLSRT